MQSRSSTSATDATSTVEPRWALAAVERSLQAVADSGCARLSPESGAEIAAHARLLARLGFTALASAVAAVESREAGAALLEAAYGCRVHRQIAAREAIQSDPAAG